MSTLYLYLSLVAGGTLTMLAFAGLLRHLLRAQARERQTWTTERAQLLDRIMLLAGRPWGLPERPPEPEVPELDYTFTPEQDPTL